MAASERLMRALGIHENEKHKMLSNICAVIVVVLFKVFNAASTSYLISVILSIPSGASPWRIYWKVLPLYIIWRVGVIVVSIANTYAHK